MGYTNTNCPGQDVKRYPWCATLQSKGFFVHQFLGLIRYKRFYLSFNKQYNKIQLVLTKENVNN